MSDIRIKTCVLGIVATNCYIVYNERTKEAVIVDPAAQGDVILEKCRELGLSVKAVLLTHGHFDHMLAVPELKRTLGVQVYASETEDGLMADPQRNLSAAFGLPPVSMHADAFVRDEEERSLLGVRWRVIATPGHTEGSVCYELPEEKVLLSGDTLFHLSYGRTDFPGGSQSQIADSINRRLFALPGDTMVYPGHGDPTTIEYETVYNPIARRKQDI